MSQAIQVVDAPGGGALVPWGNDVDIQSDRSLGKLSRIGLIAIGVLVFGIGGLLAFLPMAGAVIAPGEISVETHVKQIAHPFGGVAADILVRDGDHVKAGQVLIRLDSTVAGAAAEYTGLTLDQLLAKEARLRAVRDGASSITFAEELLRRADDPVVRAIMEDERRSFQLARTARADQIRQLQARITQTQSQINMYDSRSQAYARQNDLIDEELAQTRDLYEESLTTLDRLNALERAAVGVEAERASAAAQIAEARARIAELRTQMATIQSSARSEAALELSQVQSLLADIRTQEITASDQNDRTLIRAPLDGIVDKLAIRTIGGVVPAGDTLLEIVPAEDQLVVQAHVALTDIDAVATDRPAFIRFSALSMRTTPEIAGTVTRVSADSTVDRATGAAYYIATVSVPEEEYAKLGDVQLVVGMPVEVFIQTQERTILSYILRPLTDQLNRALRE